MRRYLLKRLLQTPLVLLLLVTVSFFMMRLAPGGPFDAEKPLDPATRAALDARYGLDRPLHEQYGRFLGRLIQGDLGPSFQFKTRTVNEIIAGNLGPSIVLGLLALSFALGIGLAAGVVSALRQNTALDYSTMTMAMVGLSVPAFVIGPLLQLLVAMRLGWLPVAEYGQGLATPRYLILPALTLALPFSARIARLTRAGMLEVINQDFVRTARAKGLREHTVILRHALRGSLLPVIAFLGPAVASLLTGSLVVEKIFQIPGLGRCFVDSALARDYTVVMGTMIVYGGFIIVFNLVTDVLLVLADPRVRHG
ncbi:MAG: ABC transporter permease [Planctomycetota bacterium]